MDKQTVKNIAAKVWAFIVNTARRVWKYLKVAKMEWIIMASVFVFDLVSKSLVENFLDYGQSVTLIPYVFNLHRIHNTAAAFGSDWLVKLLTPIGARIFFCVFAVAASVAIALVLIRNKGKSRVLRVALALFIAGALGNCVDRMFLSYVRDFIEFVYLGMTINGSKTWPYIFNIADVALVSGVILIIFYFLFLYRDPDKKSALEANKDIIAEGEGGDGTSTAEQNSENGENITADDNAENSTADQSENADGTNNAENTTADGESTADNLDGNSTSDISENSDTAANENADTSEEKPE